MNMNYVFAVQYRSLHRVAPSAAYNTCAYDMWLLITAIPCAAYNTLYVLMIRGSLTAIP